MRCTFTVISWIYLARILAMLDLCDLIRCTFTVISLIHPVRTLAMLDLCDLIRCTFTVISLIHPANTLTGQAGTGKSTAVEQIISNLSAVISAVSSHVRLVWIDKMYIHGYKVNSSCANTSHVWLVWIDKMYINKSTNIVSFSFQHQLRMAWRLASWPSTCKMSS